MVAIPRGSVDPECYGPFPIVIVAKEAERRVGRTVRTGDLQAVIGFAEMAIFTVVILAVHLEHGCEACAAAKWGGLRVSHTASQTARTR
jgi:hypothetical protein